MGTNELMHNDSFIIIYMWIIVWSHIGGAAKPQLHV